MCELVLRSLVHIMWSWCDGECLNCWRNTAADCGCPSCRSSIATCSVRICTLLQWSTWRTGKTSARLVAPCVCVCRPVQLQMSYLCFQRIYQLNWRQYCPVFDRKGSLMPWSFSLLLFMAFVGWEAFHHLPFWPSYLPSSASETFPASVDNTHHLKRHPLPSSISAVDPEANSDTLFSFRSSCRVEPENRSCPFGAQLHRFSPPDPIC